MGLMTAKAKPVMGIGDVSDGDVSDVDGRLLRWGRGWGWTERGYASSLSMPPPVSCPWLGSYHYTRGAGTGVPQGGSWR
jgi:hypothetical protein